MGQSSTKYVLDVAKPICLLPSGFLPRELGCSRLVSLAYIGEVDTQLSTDTSDKGGVIGGVMLDDNMLSVVDFLTNSVKIIDVKSNEVLSCLKLPKRPWNVTCLDQENIVVVCDRQLVFVTVGQTLSLEKKVDTSDDCHGIAYTNNTLIVSFLNPGSVKILDLEKYTWKTISTNDLFEEPCNIALSPDQKTIYVADESKNSVTSMDLEGTVQHVYKHALMLSPTSLAVDNEGRIYIATQMSGNIHIISPHCTQIQAKNNHKECAASVGPDTFVTSFKQTSVHVYDGAISTA